MQTLRGSQLYVIEGIDYLMDTVCAMCCWGKNCTAFEATALSGCCCGCLIKIMTKQLLVENKSRNKKGMAFEVYFCQARGPVVYNRKHRKVISNFFVSWSLFRQGRKSFCTHSMFRCHGIRGICFVKMFRCDLFKKDITPLLKHGTWSYDSNTAEIFKCL